MKRSIRSLLVGCLIVLGLALYLFVTADVTGNDDRRTVTGPATSVTATRSGVNVCVADPRSTGVVCGQTTTEKANGLGLHVGRCVLIEVPRGVLLGVTTNESDPCTSG